MSKRLNRAHVTQQGPQWNKILEITSSILTQRNTKGEVTEALKRSYKGNSQSILFPYKIKDDHEGQTALVEEMRNTHRILARTTVAVGKKPFEDLGLDRRTMLKSEVLYLLGCNTV
jgi:hypothetical protein